MKRHNPCSLKATCILHPALRILLLAILLLAAALRCYRLDAQSFWNDEGNSARIAERTPDLILEGAEGDIHPPGYYLLLHYWWALFGQSEFALRSLSVVAGLALVVFTYLLGRHVFGEATGLTAAFLGAISPFAVYYSQEARMYALLAALSAASTLFAIRILPSPFHVSRFTFHASRILNLVALRPLASYVLTSAAGLYVHYAFPFVLLVHNIIFGLWWLAVTRRSAHHWRWLAVWAGAQAAIVVLYLPWLPTALKSVTGWSSAGQAYELGPALLNVLRILAVGDTLPVEEAAAALVGSGLLLFAGLWPVLPPRVLVAVSPAEGPRRADRMGWLGIASIALYLLLPIVLIFAFDLYKPEWLKFLVVVLPPFHILIAHGVDNLARCVIRHRRLEALNLPISNLQSLISIFLLIVFAFITFSSLSNLYFSSAYARDDYRQIAADVAASVRPGDAVILNAPNQWEVFTYYYPDRDVHPSPYRPDPAKVKAFLDPLIERYRRLFVLYWGDAESDPQRFVEARLAAHAYKADDRWYGRVRLAIYGVAPLPEEPTVALDVHFGESIHLRGYTLAGAAFVPDDVLPVTLFWEAQTHVTERYKVTVQLLDGAGQLVAQHDTEPGDGLVPTNTWQPGQALTDRYGILLPADLPPGHYTLAVALYHIVSGERLAVLCDGESVGDHLLLGEVEIAAER